MTDHPSRHLVPSGERDLVGHGRDTPVAPWPDAARIAVSLVLNVEEGSEKSVVDGDPVGESLSEVPPPGVPGERDLTLESVFEYGSRAGVWRLLRLFERQAVPATIYASAVALERNPEIAGYLAASDHEVVAHGYRWEEVWKLDIEEEREHIRLAVDSMMRTIGRRPVGWFCRYAASINTRRLIAEEGGFEYDSDSFADDLPYLVEVNGRQWCVVPHAPDTNDLRFFRGSLATADDFFHYLKDTFETLYAEGETRPKMMTVSLHARAAGRPGRSPAVDRFITYAKQHPKVWFARRKEIARVWKNEFASR